MAGTVTIGLGLLLSLLVGYSRYTLQPERFIRTSQSGLEWLETTKTGTHNKFKIVERSEDTGGKYTIVEEVVRPGMPGFTPGKIGSPPPHIHPAQKETFTVISGGFGAFMDGQNVTAGPGQSIVVPPGAVHYFYSTDPSQDLHLSIRLEPALDADKFFEQFAGLGRDYGAVSAIPPLQLISLMAAYGLDLAFMPAPVWKVVKVVVPPLAQLLGYKTYYPEYDTAPAKV
mmetsp:Transcript_27127/g.59247  ORF Transcript_27127/g.59247 Transcript_27127/m.59247 type:complete len:228 (-) Transcript_27127:1485-2168(-)|eukprot:CAMPEP_0202892132 /NCGR_PEP_ID=MMETSP1392-20130828/1945_1 /ASSEMBLY_ACC=CAM_ASM_000868 /TAXON_ID=225041 /ORGANISM="Chlamydomonas chlamydogama, Strain SAG 11-48b" /LENGTH=227 /DNA_ID=CAMNT_0049576013 /DNA_START=106 /DNA_END=789 /DNA_ORIENTATION=+